MRFIIFSLFFFSFSSFSAPVKLVDWVNEFNRVDCASPGDVIEPISLVGCNVTVTLFGNEVNKGPITSVKVARGYLVVDTSQSSGMELFNFAVLPTCEVGEEYNPVTGQCEVISGEGFCESDTYTDLLYQASEDCSSQHPDYFTSITPSCTDENNYGFVCNKGLPRPDPDPDNGDGDGDGDNGDGDNGGGDNGDGDNGDGDGDNGDGETPDYSEIISAIEEMKLDNNSRLDNLDQQLASLNNSQTDIKQSIDDASSKNDQSLGKIETAVGDVNESVKGLEASNQSNSDSEVAAIGSVGDKVSGLSNGVNEIIDSISNVDASSVGVGVCSVGTCQSFYDSEYPDGLGGLMTGHFDTMKGQFTQGISQSFEAVDFGASSRPNYLINLDLGGLGNYGTYDLFSLAYLDVIFAFGRILFMAATIFYCRGLVMGG
ncbi:hypothetical protein ACODM8_21310 [Vibrio ostreicida]|uniref:hypothetical protein n=1 Tax=Vibrio ostreicida TaxID=526588 RepID=UPI003B5961A7